MTLREQLLELTECKYISTNNLSKSIRSSINSSYFF